MPGWPQLGFEGPTRKCPRFESDRFAYTRASFLRKVVVSCARKHRFYGRTWADRGGHGRISRGYVKTSPETAPGSPPARPRVTIPACYHPSVLPSRCVTIPACYHPGVLPSRRVTIPACYHPSVLPSQPACYQPGVLPAWHVTSTACYHLGAQSRPHNGANEPAEPGQATTFKPTCYVY